MSTALVTIQDTIVWKRMKSNPFQIDMESKSGNPI